jgi:hypothetical protein
MNRRTFLRRFATGVVAAAALAHIPASVVKMAGLTEPAKRYAIEYLDKVYKDYTKGKSSAHAPRIIEVGQELYEAYHDDLQPWMRFTSGDSQWRRPTLMFRAATVVAEGNGWYARVVA